MPRRILLALLALPVLLGLVAPAAAQVTGYTVGYFATTTGTATNTPASTGATQFTLSVAPTTLTAGATVVIDRTGPSPEVLTVASISGAVLFTTTGTTAMHIAPYAVDWATTPASPTASATIALGAVACATAPPPVQPLVVVNPTTLVWDDPASVTGQVCVSNQATFFTAVPIGNWFVSVLANSGASASPWGNPVPFGRVLSAPTRTRVIR